MKFLLTSCICLLLTSTALSAKEKSMSLTEAMRSGIISVKAVSVGVACYSSNLQLDIENKGKKPLDLFIEPGLVFSASDTAAQPLLLAGEVHLTIPSAGHINQALQTYCFQPGASCPGKGIAYHYKEQADSNIVRTLRYIQQHKTPGALAQKALWTWTSHKPLHTVYEPSEDLASRNFSVFLAAFTRQALPAYYTYFELQNGAASNVSATKSLRVYATLKWTQQNDGPVTLAVYNEKNVAVQTIFEQQPFKAGAFEFNVRFETANVPPGRYFIRLSAASATVKEIPVTIE